MSCVRAPRIHLSSIARLRAGWSRPSLQGEPSTPTILRGEGTEMDVFHATTPVMALLGAVVGYLAGSIPFGLLLTRWAGLGDVRAIGSGNIGATNVLRTGNKTLAALTLIADAAKGTIPILIMKERSEERRVGKECTVRW